jgi:hypothetical protein
MVVAGFNFTKILAERKGAAKAKVNISNNVALKKVEEAKFSMGAGEQKGIRFEFEFVSRYEPEIGGITLLGDLLYIENDKITAETLKMWAKEKKIPNNVMTPVINTILQRSNIQALILSQEVGLPSPIPLPRVDAETKTETKK